MHPISVRTLPVGQTPTDKPGLFLVTSADERYGMTLAALEAGEIELRGERYVSPTEKAIVFERLDRKSNPAIGIGREFFLTALRDYSSWQLKWWREAVQNAVDAGATQIVCTVVHNGDVVEVSCEDNGRGMSREVLVDKFLVLGGTTKTGVDTTGGFGKAKELLLLPWLSWSVHTLGIEAKGEGISYEVTDAPARKGTKLTVTMPASNCTEAYQATHFISRCNLPHVSFTVVRKGRDMVDDRAKAKASLAGKQLLREDEHMAIYFTPAKDDQYEGIYIRSNGLYMFTEYVGETIKKGVIIVELKGSTVNILTANRDGFRDYKVASGVKSFVRDYLKDKSRVMRKPAVRERYAGTHRFTAELKAKRLLDAKEAASSALTFLGDGSAGAVAELKLYLDAIEPETDDDLHLRPAPATTAALLGAVKTTPSNLEAIAAQMVWTPAYYVYSDEGYRVPQEFYPATMTPRIVKLLSVWTELCRFALMSLSCEKFFGVGFLFSEEAVAQHTREDGEHWLLLNPYRDVKKHALLLRPSNRDDLAQMFASAVHEVTHMVDNIGPHDEAFAAALTVNMGKCGDGFQSVRAIEKTIKQGDVAPQRRENPTSINAGMKWVNVGGGAQVSEDKRFYIQVKSRYLGKGKTDRFVTMTDLSTNEHKDYGTIKLAKAAASRAR